MYYKNIFDKMNLNTNINLELIIAKQKNDIEQRDKYIEKLENEIMELNKSQMYAQCFYPKTFNEINDQLILMGKPKIDKPPVCFNIPNSARFGISEQTGKKNDFSHNDIINRQFC
jgi:hypothetical protein